ncbi:MAG: CpsD/CapB family tyrosine-protein kinase [Candidatus Eisenbacteria bacterium]|nr:CpsD/CapB family tyrosine-protein kinase [Candidatus Eisenbacteria bacterium]
MKETRILEGYDPEAPSAIEFRRLYSRLRYKQAGKAISPLMVTSAKHEEGKTTTAAFLSVTIARQEKGRVLLMDMDLHRPRMHRLFGLPLRGGATELLRGTAEPEEVVRPTSQENLFILTSGSMVKSPSALVDSEHVGPLFRRLAALYDTVVIDSPPLLPVSDGMVLAGSVSAVLFVIMAGKTPREVVLRGKEILRDVDAPLAGVVINNTKGALPYYYDYKYYGYRYK